MIRINLLPKREIKKREDIRVQLLLSIGLIVLVLAGCLFYQFHLSNQIQFLETTKSEREAELKKYEAIVKKVTEMEKKVATVKKRIQLINSISIYRSAVIRSLDQIVMSIIPNKVYIRTLTHSKDVISLEGTAKDHDSVAEFMERLKLQGDITNIFLRNATLKPAQGQEGELVDFSLVCDTIYKPPPPPPPPKGK